ncbi:MAG: tyrosine-type recombinase/integrase [Acidimicrobiia bacterium]|nr:tyrosine-type recombinase/integrase [Acidimicrobiia bacterium]MDH5237328.1 tyrosine-type recombinase/integrase [Acidimicrobiia bacterium]
MSERDTTKAGKGRTVTLGPTSLIALTDVRARAEQRAALVEAEIPADGWVFSDHETAKTPWALHRPTRMFAQARDTVGLDPDLHLHDFRHAAATQALTAGHDTLTVAGRLGHRRVSTTTDRYGHVIPSADQDIADHLDNLLTNDEATT